MERFTLQDALAVGREVLKISVRATADTLVSVADMYMQDLVRSQLASQAQTRDQEVGDDIGPADQSTAAESQKSKAWADAVEAWADAVEAEDYIKPPSPVVEGSTSEDTVPDTDTFDRPVKAVYTSEPAEDSKALDEMVSEYESSGEADTPLPTAGGVKLTRRNVPPPPTLDVTGDTAPFITRMIGVVGDATPVLMDLDRSVEWVRDVALTILRRHNVERHIGELILETAAQAYGVTLDRATPRRFAEMVCPAARKRAEDHVRGETV